MKAKWKKSLHAYFYAPSPKRKDAFFARPEFSRAGATKVFLSQAAYIRKWVWGLQAFVFLSVLFGVRVMDRDMLWCVCALAPFLSMAAVTECGRSEAYGMAEFELSTKFSLKFVVLARLCILGAADVLLLCLTVPLVLLHGDHTLLQTGVYILCPYSLTALFALYTVRVVRGRQSLHLCGGAALLVSAASAMGHEVFPGLYSRVSFPWWIIALLLLGAGSVMQCRKLLKERSEMSWSL